tara:strand:- start:3447 stop:3788 length:342 start_codon:yes stop_codon:yes gene_type:complete
MKIDSYSFGRIIIEGKSYDSDVILYKGTVYPNWWRMNGHLFQIDDIEKHLKKNPKKLLIGTGFSEMMKVDPEAKSYLNKASIEVIIESTSNAWKTFNSLSDEEDVMAAFHLTC